MIGWRWTSFLKGPAGTAGDGQREKSVWASHGDGCDVRQLSTDDPPSCFWCDPLDVCLLCLCAAAEPRCHAVRQHTFTARKVDQQLLCYVFSSVVSWGRAGVAGHFPHDRGCIGVSGRLLLGGDFPEQTSCSLQPSPLSFGCSDWGCAQSTRLPDSSTSCLSADSSLLRDEAKLRGVVCRFKDVVRWAGGSVQPWGTPIWWSGLKSGAVPVVLSEPIGHKVQTPGAQWGVYQIYCKSLSLGISLHGRIDEFQLLRCSVQQQVCCILCRPVCLHSEVSGVIKQDERDEKETLAQSTQPWSQASQVSKRHTYCTQRHTLYMKSYILDWHTDKPNPCVASHGVYSSHSLWLLCSLSALRRTLIVSVWAVVW